jgi:UDP:flavonoid glycosyltransferase YjiC (YdhE family)
LNITRGRLGLKPATDDLAAWESAELLLVTVPTWFDLATDYPANVVHAGPLGVNRAPRDMSIAGRRPLVMLSFSTTVMPGQVDLIHRVCEAIAGQELDAMITLGPAVSPDAIRAPHNIEVIPYADHDQLLPRCAAVITHGGLGTTLRTLAHGKPLLLLPLGRDQHFNAERVVELGAGICLPVAASPDEIESALLELLAQPRFREAPEGAATAIATGRPDQTAAAALSSLGRFAR